MVVQRSDLIDDGKSEKKVTLDVILEEEIGEFGRYQARMVALTAVVAIFASWNSEYVFTTARIPTRCVIPECESISEQLEFSPAWLLHAVPTTDQGAVDGCHRYALSLNTTVSGAGDANGNHTTASCPATLFDYDVTMPCQELVYKYNNTITYDFDLGCDEWRRTLLGAARKMGTLVSMPMVGYVSDRWGRCKTMVITTINSGVIGIARIWAYNYTGFIVSEFTEALFGSSNYICAHILMMELIGQKYRIYANASINTFFSLGQVLLGMIAWQLPYWRHLTIALYVPHFVVIFYLWFMSESVRWYMSKGRFEDSQRVLTKVARFNKKHISDDKLQALKMTFEEQKKKETELVEPLLIVQLLKHKRVLLHCLITPVWFISAIMTYFGLSINSVNLTGNKYLNYVAVSCVEIPGCWTAVLLMNRIGRKPVLIGSFWTCGACLLGYIVIPNGWVVVSQILYLVGKYSIAMVMLSMYVYTGELYPTRYRHRLFAASSAMGVLGGICAPLTPAFTTIWKYLPFALFGGLGLLSGFLAFITPETLGTRLPTTMEQAAHLGLGKRNANCI